MLGKSGWTENETCSASCPLKTSRARRMPKLWLSPIKRSLGARRAEVALVTADAVVVANLGLAARLDAVVTVLRYGGRLGRSSRNFRRPDACRRRCQCDGRLQRRRLLRLHHLCKTAKALAAGAGAGIDLFGLVIDVELDFQLRRPRAGQGGKSTNDCGHRFSCGMYLLGTFLRSVGASCFGSMTAEQFCGPT